MKIQKQVSDKRGDKIYHKYVIVLKEKLLKQANLKEGDELEAEVKEKGILLRKK